MSIEKYLSNIESFKGKKIIITGATSGIGLELAKHLIKKDAQLVILARNPSKADKVKKELLGINPKGIIDIVIYDQSDYQLIDKACEIIKEKHSDFYALVANAGILYPPKGENSKQGYPLTIDTNFLGLKRFLDNMTSSYKGKRFVMHGSLVAVSYVSKKVDIYNGKYTLFKQYNLSKACVEALWHHYLTDNSDNEFILCEPGVVSTDIFRGFNWFFRVVGGWFVRVFSHSPRKSALTLLKALSNHSKNGDYIVPRGIFTIFGYPKYKKFPNHRKREYLINKVRN